MHCGKGDRAGSKKYYCKQKAPMSSLDKQPKEAHHGHENWQHHLMNGRNDTRHECVSDGAADLINWVLRRH